MADTHLKKRTTIPDFIHNAHSADNIPLSCARIPRLAISKTFLADIFVMALLIPLFFVSCSKAPHYEDARISIEPNTADFGTIQANDPIAFHEVSLTVTNQGKKPLKIENIELPEGFRYSITPRGKIASGGKSTLRITLDIRKYSGTISETAYVSSNDPSQQRMPIALEATLIGERTDFVFEVRDEPDIEFDHKVVNLGLVDRHQTLEHHFEFENVGKQPLKIMAIESFCKCLTGKPSKAVVPPGDSSAIIAVFYAYKWKARTFRKALLITTNDPDEPSISLTIVANITDAITLEPREILLPNIPQGQPGTAETKLIQQGKGKLDIKSIETSSPKVSATSAAGRRQNLR